MATTGQTINDRLNAVRYALVGQGLARTVCKATTEEVLGPKRKHIDYLLACTNEPNVSIPQLANLLIERTQHSSWAVVFKSLITIHHLMSYGNERFTQYLATSNHSFELDDFMDRTTPQGYNMSTFVRRYAKYINNKSISYRTLAIDLCKIRSGNDNALRTMNMDNLSKTLPIVQAQFDSLLDFSVESKDLNNGIITSAFRLLCKDLFKLYVAYQEAIINLLERYFKLSRKKTREALEMYKRYLARMDRVAGFLRVVEAVGLDKSEMPDLTDKPASILAALEQHLAQLEAKKRGATPASPENPQGEGEENIAEEQAVVSKAEPHESTTEPNKTEVIADKPKTPEPAPAQAPKPSRPSPCTAVKASTSTTSPKAAPDRKSDGAGSSGQQSAAEKKGPPPSRPPPPAAASPSSQAPSSSSPKKGGDSTTKQDSTPKVASPGPPPHPPPPTHPPAPARLPTPPPSSQAIGSSIDNNDNNANENPPPEDAQVSSQCSQARAIEVQPDANNQQQPQNNGQENNHSSQEDQVAANHINNGDQEIAAAEEAMPPPPPPIDDLELGEAAAFVAAPEVIEAPANNQEQAGEVPPVEPNINGSLDANSSRS